MWDNTKDLSNLGDDIIKKNYKGDAAQSFLKSTPKLIGIESYKKIKILLEENKAKERIKNINISLISFCIICHAFDDIEMLRILKLCQNTSRRTVMQACTDGSR